MVSAMRRRMLHANALGLCAVVAASTAASALQNRGVDHAVPSRPETVVWGWIPIDRPPVLTVQSGQTVRGAVRK